MNDTKNREFRNTDDGDLEVCRAVASTMYWIEEWENLSQLVFLQDAPEQMKAAVKSDYAANLECARKKWAKARANLEAVVDKGEYGPLGSAALLYFIDQLSNEDVGSGNEADNGEIWDNVNEIVRSMSFTAKRAFEGEESAEAGFTPAAQEVGLKELEKVAVGSSNSH